jgi:hypothetical protein
VIDRLLAPLRGIVADLIRKRLWPIAVGLLAMLVAVPVLMARSPSSPNAPPGSGAVAVAPANAGSDAPLPAAPAAKPGGRVRDPFFAPPRTPPAGERSGSPAAPADAGAAEPAKPPAPGKGTHAPAAAPRASASPSASAFASAPSRYYRTVVQQGDAAGAGALPIARLTPIGGRTDPVALYLGVMKVGRPYAVFLLASRATSQGEATCQRATSCAIIGLRAGDTQTIAVAAGDGRAVRRFTLHVTSMRSVATSRARAQTMRAWVHPDGRVVEREMLRSAATAQALGLLRYRETAGLLYAVAPPSALAQGTR